LVLILAIAIGARIASSLLAPFIPTIIALIVIGTLMMSVVRRH
jgi:hypothetical protein